MYESFSSNSSSSSFHSIYKAINQSNFITSHFVIHS